MPFGISKDKVKKEIEEKISKVDESNPSAAFSEYMDLMDYIIEKENKVGDSEFVAEKLNEIGEKLIEMGENMKAIQCFEKSLNRVPNNIETLIKKGEA